MKIAGTYDKTDRVSILNHAKKLKNRSLRDVLDEASIEEILHQFGDSRGRLGQLVEKYFFGLQNNSRPEPDLAEAGVEIKTSPLKKVARGLVSKERIVLNIIDYMTEGDRTFKTSSFWTKNQLLLLLFYLFEKDQLKIDSKFKCIDYWQFPEMDLKIIEDDWMKIANKIKSGKAHELSESDTLYLGACTKGADKNSHRKQKYSTKTAMQRAFSLKQKYVNAILDNGKFDKATAIVNSINEYAPNQTFEDFVVQKFRTYIGLTEAELMDQFDVPDTKAKNRFHIIATAIVKRILGIKSTQQIEEFKKAGVLLKTVRVEPNGSIKEHMSFMNIKYEEIVNEDWEDSEWNNELNRRFFFVVFKRDAEGALRLQGVKFWGMPASDIEVGHQFWLDIQQRILEDEYEDFWRASDDKIFHVRTKGRNRRDLMRTPTARMERKKAYWINKSYIQAAISDIIN